MSIKRVLAGHPDGGQFASGDAMREEAGQIDAFEDDWGDTPQPKRSPWGEVQYPEEYAPGITRVSTEGHGGYKLSPERNRAVPKPLRNSDGWYEEDCEAHIVHAIHGTNDADRTSGWQGLREWYPDQYEEVTGQEVLPGESVERDRKVFREEHADDWIGVAASMNPDGTVKVTAVKGGVYTKDATRREYQVSADEYEQRSRFGYVVPDELEPVSEYVPEPWQRPTSYSMGRDSARIQRDLGKLYRASDGTVESVGDIIEAGRMTRKTVSVSGSRRSYALVEDCDGYSHHYAVSKETFEAFEAPDTRTERDHLREEYQIAEHRYERSDSIADWDERKQRRDDYQQAREAWLNYKEEQ